MEIEEDKREVEEASTKVEVNKEEEVEEEEDLEI